MQKTFVKITSKKILATAVLSGAFAIASAAESTEIRHENVEIISANIQSSIEFLGAAGNIFLFNVKVANPDGETIAIEIQDDEGMVLFSKKYSDTNISKKIRILNEEFNAHFNFIIRPQNTNAEQTFVVSITSKFADDPALVSA